MDLSSFAPTPTCDLVGFLPVGESLCFDGGRFEPVDDFARVHASVQEATNRDHFIYPPIERTQTASLLDATSGRSEPSEQLGWKDVPNTERPALLHRLPASHFLYLERPPIGASLRMADGAFLMHAVGYVFGYRMQFYDWWFDGRVHMRSAHHAHVRMERACAFLAKAFETWRGWSETAQKRFTNSLYMLSRAETHEWDWERFAIYYMVFDALYRTAHEVHSVSAQSHPGRLQAMCAHYGLYTNVNHFARIAALRRDLFHETLWGGAQPCSAIAQDCWYQVDNLRRINERLIPAMVGFRADYIVNPWDHIGMASF